jgi:hypothetical protein
MKTPTEASIEDTVSPAIRYSRDQFWDRGIGARAPLTPETAGHYAVSEGSFPVDLPELPEVPNRAILIGTFSGFRSMLTASRRAIYTEVTVDVTQVFEDASNRRPGSKITLLFAGGTVLTATGQEMSFLTQPRSYFMQPGRSYVLLLSYHHDGDFYSAGEEI